MTVYYVVDYISYGQKRKATHTYDELKRESEQWGNFKGRSMRDLVNFKYEKVVKILKTKSFNKAFK